MKRMRRLIQLRKPVCKVVYEVDDIIRYIFDHDGKRVLPPPKSSKRYANYKKRQKLQKKREAINNVLRLIDSLHAVPCST